MTTPGLIDFYQVGASLPADAPSYVMRQADERFYQKLKAHEFCTVLNSRQMGKSSLRRRTMRRLHDDGVICFAIDLLRIGTCSEPEQWYAGIVNALAKSHQLNKKIDWMTWWRHRDLISPVDRLRLFIEEVLLTEYKQPIVIFIDEVDGVLRQPFSLDDFFTSSLRRKSTPPFSDR